MDYVSTREIAQKWGISTARVVALLKANRIPGARLVGKSWMIPSNAEKPADNRRKSAKATATAPSSLPRFPLFYCDEWSEEDVRRDFSEDEKVLYQSEILLLRGDYAASYDLSKALLRRSVPLHLQAVALYGCAFCSIYLGQHPLFFQYLYQLQTLFMQDFAYKSVLEPLIHDLESYYQGSHYYLNSFKITPGLRYMPGVQVSFLLASAYAAYIKAFISKSSVETAPYELFCTWLDTASLPYPSVTLHKYLTLMYLLNGDRESAVYHLKKGIEKSLDSGFLFTLSSYYSYIPQVYEMVLQEFPEEVAETIKAYADVHYEAISGLQRYMNDQTTYDVLKKDDFEYIFYAMNNLSNQEIAERKQLSVTTIGKRYSALFEKTNTHSKKELVELIKKIVTVAEIDSQS